jgi:transposase
MDEQTTGSGSQVTRPRTYTDEYRRQVVDMVASTGRTAMSVAAELGIHHTLISRWMRRYGQATQVAAPTPRPTPTSPLKPVSVPHADQAAEIARLKREVERLRMERDILKNRRGPAPRLWA